MTRLSGLPWEGIPFERRLDSGELLGPSFDSRGQVCEHRIFLFATPRSASWTVCRYLTAAGWGIACEYFSDQIVDLSCRLLHLPEARSFRYDELDRYRSALEDSRSRNGIFSSKVFWHEFQRLKRAYSEAELQAASHLFLYRRDFAAQVASMTVGMRNLSFSFSEQTHDAEPLLWPRADDAAALRRCAEHLLNSERAWFNEFRRRGWRPHLIEAETLLDAPVETFARLAPRLGLHFDEANLLRCRQFEHNARYATGARSKQRLATDHASILAEYESRRAEQFALDGGGVLQV